MTPVDPGRVRRGPAGRASPVRGATPRRTPGGSGSRGTGPSRRTARPSPGRVALDLTVARSADRGLPAQPLPEGSRRQARGPGHDPQARGHLDLDLAARKGAGDGAAHIVGCPGQRCRIQAAGHPAHDEAGPDQKQASARPAQRRPQPVGQRVERGLGGAVDVVRPAPAGAGDGGEEDQGAVSLAGAGGGRPRGPATVWAVRFTAIRSTAAIGFASSSSWSPSTPKAGRTRSTSPAPNTRATRSWAPSRSNASNGSSLAAQASGREPAASCSRARSRPARTTSASGARGRARSVARRDLAGPSEDQDPLQPSGAVEHQVRPSRRLRSDTKTSRGSSSCRALRHPSRSGYIRSTTVGASRASLAR